MTLRVTWKEMDKTSSRLDGAYIVPAVSQNPQSKREVGAMIDDDAVPGSITEDRRDRYQGQECHDSHSHSDGSSLVSATAQTSKQSSVWCE